MTAPAELRGDRSGREEPQANDTAGKFLGTDNPRHLRAIALLLVRPAKRSELEDRAGCMNGPELMAELRRRGLDAPCERIECLDRDGRTCHPGIYSFTPTDRRKLMQWMTTREQAWAVRRETEGRDTVMPNRETKELALQLTRGMK